MPDSAKHVFVSYVKEDRADVDRLCRILERAKIPYWRDRKDLAPGDAWKAKIREAIRAGSLVLLACFSAQSRARQKSYMNEELTLAVEEFRKLSPGATWLIPVRFDDGDVPEWDLGAGRVLTDLNYADLFGDDYAAEAAGLITTINSAMGAVDDPVQVVAAVDSATAADRPRLLRQETKGSLLDPTRRIQLDDLVKNETRRVVAALEGPDAFPVALTQSAREAGASYVVERARKLVELVEPSSYSMQVAARFASAGGLGAWTAALRSLSHVGTKPASGMTGLLSLRALPALHLFLTGAIAAHAAERWDIMQALTAVTVLNERGTVDPIAHLISPWTPFASGEPVPNVLARAATNAAHDEASLIESISAGRVPKLFTPVNEWLLHILRPVFDEQFVVEGEFEAEFNATETFLGVVSQDAANQNESAYVHRSRWFGRDTWQDRWRSPNPVAGLRQKFEGLQQNWPPVYQGMFGGDRERARTALEAYEEQFVHIASQRL
jgi:hypothetical protein